MANVIAVCNQKGGVGKTTTATALAQGLHKKGFRVLAIDMDPQASMSFCYNVDTDLEGSAYDGHPSVYDLMKHSATFEESVIQTPWGDLIPSSIDLSMADAEFMGQMGRENILKRILSSKLDNYDWVVIDTPPNLSVMVFNAMTVATDIIIPVNPGALSVKALGQLKETIDAVHDNSNPSLQVMGLLITKYSPTNNISKDYTDLLRETGSAVFGRTFKTAIRQSVAVEKAQDTQVSIFDSSSKPGRDYETLIDEIIAIKEGE